MTNSETRILLIDDEIECLDQIKASLTSKGDQWTIEVSTNPRQALDSIQENPPRIVICDYRMPELNGAELLRKVEQAHPFLNRFIIADREELEILETGIGSAFHYLPKPCPPNRLVSEIQRSLVIESWLGKTQIRNIIGTLGELPGLPSLYQKIVNGLNESDISIEKVGKAISTDIVISAKILKIVNSSYFGFDETISDITHAVSVLGIETVKNLVLAIQVFSETGSREQKTQTDQLWHHSMSVANGAKKLMMHESGIPRLAEGAYTSGLFHDIGKLIMQRATPDAYRSAQEYAQFKDVSSWEAESEILGCNHAEVGAYLLARWGLPTEVVESAALHHQPAASAGTSFSSLGAVYVSNRLLSNSENIHDPNSSIDCSFISEMGKADRWPIWQQVLVGDGTSESDHQADKEDPSHHATPIPQPQKIRASNPASDICLTDAPTESWARKSKVSQRAIATLLGIAASIAFGVIIFFKDTSSETIGDKDESWLNAQTSFQSVDKDSRENRPNTNGPHELIDEPYQSKFDMITAEELVVESFGPYHEPIRFPKIKVTKIYHDLPIPLANINSKLVRIGDDVSGARIVDIEQKNVIVQYEGLRKSYSLK